MKTIKLFFSIVFLLSTVVCQAQTKENKSKDGVYQEVEEMPEYPGGEKALMNDLIGKIKYPEEAKKNGIYAVRFKGNMISFVNALWTGFEIIDKDVLGDDRFEVRVKMRNDSSFEDLLKVLIGEVKIEAAWEVLPSMQDVFIDLVQPVKILDDEK